MEWYNNVGLKIIFNVKSVLLLPKATVFVFVGFIICREKEIVWHNWCAYSMMMSKEHFIEVDRFPNKPIWTIPENIPVCKMANKMEEKRALFLIYLFITKISGRACQPWRENQCTHLPDSRTDKRDTRMTQKCLIPYNTHTMPTLYMILWPLHFCL